MKRIAQGSIPGDRFPMIGRSLTAEQVGAKSPARCWRARIQSRKRNSHGAIPYLCRRIDPRRYLKSGVPRPPHRMIREIEIDIEIGPLLLRRKFELLVSANIVKVGTDEQLSDIPFP